MPQTCPGCAFLPDLRLPHPRRPGSRALRRQYRATVGPMRAIPCKSYSRTLEMRWETNFNEWPRGYREAFIIPEYIIYSVWVTRGKREMCCVLKERKIKRIIINYHANQPSLPCQFHHYNHASVTVAFPPLFLPAAFISFRFSLSTSCCTWSPAPTSSSDRPRWTPSAMFGDCCSMATNKFRVLWSNPGHPKGITTRHKQRYTRHT